MKQQFRSNDQLLNALTFDVEDWFHGLVPKPGARSGYEDRLAIGLSIILDILAEFEVKATFFVLASLVKSHPQLILDLANAGHEIGSHGLSHVPIYQQTPTEFQDELYRSIAMLEDLIGQPIYGHRAAFFSITVKTLWVLPLLAKAGLSYDSSIFPIYNGRCGIPSAPRFPHRLACGLIEFPISTVRLGSVNLPFSGGVYARLLPYPIIHGAIQHLNKQQQPALVYFHPWEFDPTHPRLYGTVSPLYYLTHYYNLYSTAGKLRAILKDFQFGPVCEVLSLIYQKVRPFYKYCLVE
jgi:polysaccharide deacetylase family protein (PEP-CTERM system associated)